MNIIRELSAPVWKGRRCSRHALKKPSFADVKKCILALNGLNMCEVYLAITSENYLSICNGYDGLFMVIDNRQNEVFFNLVNPRLLRSKELVDVMSGGQSGPQPVALLNSLRPTLLAAQFYFETGGVNPKLDWRSNQELEKLKII